MDEDTKKYVLIVVVVIAVIAAGLSVYKTSVPPSGRSVGTLNISKEGGPPGGNQVPEGPAKAAESSNPDAGDVLSGAPPDAQGGR